MNDKAETEYQQIVQEWHEAIGIDSRLAAAQASAQIIERTGPNRHLPADYPGSMLSLAASSLGRMRRRQERYQLSPVVYERASTEWGHVRRQLKNN